MALFLIIPFLSMQGKSMRLSFMISLRAPTEKSPLFIGYPHAYRIKSAGFLYFSLKFIYNDADKNKIILTEYTKRV